MFVDAFAQFGVEMSLEVARGPMGMGKWDHIRTLCDLPAIASQYEARFGRLPTDDDVTAIYERFLPMQLEKWRTRPRFPAPPSSCAHCASAA